MTNDSVERESRATGTRGRAASFARGRRLWLDLHFYIGLVAGAVFVVLGLSGSLLAFRVEIDEWLNRDFFVATDYRPGGARASIDRIIEASQAATPKGAHPYWVHFPTGQGGYFDVISKTGGVGGGEKILQTLVDPRDASVLGQRVIIDENDQFAEPLSVFLIHLHSALLLGETGATIVGFAGLFLFLSLATGVYLWLPRNGRWRQAFAIKRGASAERLALDLHKTTGAYLCGVFVVMLFSGVYLTFGSQVRALVGLFSPVGVHHMDEGLKSAPAEGRAPIAAEAAVAAVDRLFPDGRLMSLALPEGPDGVYVVGKRADDEVNRSEPRRVAAVDRYSGEIIHIQDPHAFTAGEKFLEWQYPLHTGEAFGDFGRAFVGLLGVAPALLYVTGLMRWLQKRRAQANGEREHRRGEI
ncbi:PepSY domain-containing protein [Methylosinus sp. H3A]|uniref:PepSY-associated TM helix domain-containing protein n=1 Tax=Methylosinus sp. H3A TaxID=2785786 RepID=UPI0018C1DB4F|nr:PepSY-associated TM helix domain-containing protein [Methylosinus sp. H3A]MBG0812485.1 PepSY domain-containing protein [Methylosinus sp. H3A]